MDQLIDDVSVSMVILNVLLNVKDVEEGVSEFKTEGML